MLSLNSAAEDLVEMMEHLIGATAGIQLDLDLAAGTLDITTLEVNAVDIQGGATAKVTGLNTEPLATGSLQLAKFNPRTLAALGAAINRLHAPAIAAAAFSRLNQLDADVCRLDRLAALGDLLERDRGT